VILAIDTSSAISVAVLDGDRVLAQRSEFSPRGHAELLSAMIEGTLAEAGIGGDAVDQIVVGTGPAPFTGLRVGLVTARTLGLVWGVPVRGACSLDAVGAQVGDETSAAGGSARVTVVADARRKEVYWSTYTDGVPDGGPQVSAPGDVAVVGTVVGRGALLYPDAFPDASAADPDPAWLARVVTRRLAAGETEFPTEPLYLRRPDVHGIPGA
jgi:tRNA threonylcarbamoyladenosine biosynthesis protein TsaB